ncbi:DUF4180 domain-containing protein [Pseudonocardia yunnanensis]|uniref:DUF4180 domain-containing protein n=1 Tax=Pseudonocardia yunnanensis TaxID=58107 RepID=A0ABW4F052_9PSEU
MSAGPVADIVTNIRGTHVLVCAPDGPKLRTSGDAVEMIGEALYQRADLVAVPVERLDPGFFTLSTGIAGEIVQKFVNYRLRLAVRGDLSEHLARSASLRAFVVECNRGRHLWFVADDAELGDRLTRKAPAASE